MKHLFAFLVCWLSAQASLATIWYVDPSISSPLVFDTITEAIDAASAYDTIMVRGSHWIQFAIDKPLTLYGEGYSDITGNKTNIFGRVDIASDSVHISGFRIQGFGASFPLTIVGPVSNITVERCKIEGQISILPGDITNIRFRNDIFDQYSGYHNLIIAASNVDSLFFENNIFNDYYITPFGTPAGTNTIILRNNLFLNGAPFWPVFETDCSAKLYNNAFYNSNPDGCPSCTYTYNVFWNDSIGYDTLITGNGNLNHVNPGLVNYDGGVFDFNDDYSLSDTSQCIGAGLNGVDIGITGGYYPYHIGEGPKIPLVTYANIGSSADEQNPVYYLQFDSRARTDVFYPGTLISNNDSVHLVQAEYWIDSIPIPGTGTLISLTATDTLFYIDSIPGLQLDTGAHTISVRARDDRGNWGFVFSDETRNEYYDVGITQKMGYYIRQGTNTKLEVEVTNRSTVDLAEQYVVIRSSRFFEMNFKNEVDSIGGMFVGNIPKGVQYPTEHMVPIWIGKLDAQSSITLDLYLTFPEVSPHEIISVSAEVLGDKSSTLQRAFDLTHSDSLFHASLYCSSMITALDALSDSLGMSSVTYDDLVVSMEAWADENHLLFTDVVPLNILLPAYLFDAFALVPDSELMEGLNLMAYGAFVARSYNTEVSLGDSSQLAQGSARDVDPNCDTGSCDCLAPLPYFSAPNDYGVPLEPTSNFRISYGCKLRCDCMCEGSWTREACMHRAIDIYPKYINDPCQIPVKAISEGDATPYVDAAGAYGVQVWSIFDGHTVMIDYNHLCDEGRASGHVYPGSVLGYLGSSGLSTGPHVHLEVLVDGQKVPPDCYENVWAAYGRDPDAFVDQPCEPLTVIHCLGQEVENVHCPEGGFEVSTNGTCHSNWEKASAGGCHDGITPDDPNDKVGNIGSGAPRYIQPTDQLHYGVFFENVDSATTAAQVVHIVDTLDVTKVDASTFYFENITAGEMLIVLPDSVHLQALDTVYMKEPVNGCYVHVQASFDPVTGIADVLLTSLDTFPPYTPVDGLWEGMLPPDTTDFDGNGMVTFRVMPIPTIPDGTVIYNTARIVFDSNPAIQTGTWFNTIDGEVPTSFVHALPATTPDTSFVVQWEGSDGGSGVIDFDIYTKLSGDTVFTKWLSHTSLDSAVFIGAWDSTYQFYSIAYDSVGNMESKLPLVEAFTTLHEIITGIDYIVNSEDVRVYPNPTNGKLTVEAAIRGGEDLSIDIFDLLGHRIASFKLAGSSGAYLRREIDLGDQADGVYLLRLNDPDPSTPKKFVLKKN